MNDNAVKAMYARGDLTILTRAKKLSEKIKRLTPDHISYDACMLDSAILELLKISRRYSVKLSDRDVLGLNKQENPVDQIQAKIKHIQEDEDSFDAYLKQEKCGKINVFVSYIRALKKQFRKEKPSTSDDIVRDIAQDITKPLDHIFGDKDRLYFRLNDNSDSSVHDDIYDYLTQKSADDNDAYKIIDYQNGLASDARGNKRKIGRLIKDKQGLKFAFEEDPSRMAKELVIVLSRREKDICKGSYKRGWKSCRAGMFASVDTGLKEAGEGVLVAYLIRPDDPDISDPLTRIYIKPYVQNTLKSEFGTPRVRINDVILYKAFTPIGFFNPAMKNAIDDYIDTVINADTPYDDYILPSVLESFEEPRRVTYLPNDAEAALQILKIGYKKQNDVIYVKDLNLVNLGIHKLPDFSDVVVSGTFNVSHNPIMSLKNMPQSIGGDILVFKTKILNFDYAPDRIGGEINYCETPYLQTVRNIPKASKYMYGNGKANRDAGTTPKSRMDDPARFRRFRKI